jgi:hypothetical protein
MVSVGAKRIVYGKVGSQMITDEVRDAIALMMKGRDIEFVEYDVDVRAVLVKVLLYMDRYYDGDLEDIISEMNGNEAIVGKKEISA